MNDVAGHVIGFADWYDAVIATVNKVENTWNNECPNKGSWLRIRACRIEASLVFTEEIARLGVELGHLTGGSVEVVQIFVDGMRDCISNQPV